MIIFLLGLRDTKGNKLLMLIILIDFFIIKLFLQRLSYKISQLLL